jgi:hypothetical protein
MKCRRASVLLVEALLSGGGLEEGGELADHLKDCVRCRQRAGVYAHIRDEVRALEPVAPPEQLPELIERTIEEARSELSEGARPPANPAPERSGRQKAAIFVGVLVGLMALTGGLLALLGGGAEPLPRVGRVAMMAGPVEVRTPGMSRWREAGPGESLPPGVQLGTGADALLKVEGDGVEWWLPSMTALALDDGRRAELMMGRLYVRCGERPDGPVRLAGGGGVVACAEGAFTASVSSSHLNVGCAEGLVEVEQEAEAVPVGPGRAALLVEGQVSGPVRDVRKGELTHWLRAFASHGEGHLSPRQLASVPLPREQPVLPDGVRLARLDLSLEVGGPLVHLAAEPQLVGQNGERWGRALSLADVTLLRPVDPRAAAAGLELVGAMRPRNRRYAVGLDLSAWTHAPVGELRVTVRGTADGGVRTFECPTLAAPLRRPDPLDWSASRQHFDPARPLVFEFEFAETEGVDVMAGAGAAGAHLLAWRPDPPREDWLHKGRNYFIAFEATGDFGAMSRAGVHEVLERLLRSLPPGASTALIAYDGTLKLDPDGLMRHHPSRVEVMIERLWQLDGRAGEAADGFLPAAMALASQAGEDNLLVYVTGRRVPARAGQIEAPEGLVLAVLQVGADAPGPAFRDLCGRTGGVALALPESAPPGLAVLDFVSNLRVPGLGQVLVRMAAGGEARLLRGAGGFGTYPVVAAVTPPQGATVLEGSFAAQAAGRALQRRFELALPRP